MYKCKSKSKSKYKKEVKKGWACQYSHGPTAFPRNQVRTTQLSICFKSQFLRKIISISSPKERNTVYLKLKKYSWQTEKSGDNPSSASVSNLNSHERLFPFPPPPCFTSHFLFLPDPWYLLRCRWMVGNSDGSVIETYSPDPAAAAAGGDNNKISISANFHHWDRCLCRPNGPPGVRISDMKYSSRPQI